MRHRRSGFTLVEVLIVVVIMAILAAAIIPRFSDSSNQAKVGTAEFNWHTLKVQIETFRAEHKGNFPASLEDLTETTNISGQIGKSAASGYLYGPYISEIPVNPWNNSNTIAAATEAPAKFSDTDGWYYNAANGDLWLVGKEGGSDKVIGDD